MLDGSPRRIYPPGQGGLGRGVAQKIDQKSTGNFAGLMAAHAVRHRPQAAFRTRQQGIFVNLAPATDMGTGNMFEAHGFFFRGAEGWRAARWKKRDNCV